MELKLGQWVVIGMVTLMVLGYMRGIYYNRRRSGQVMAWLEDGLKTIGQVSSEGQLPGMPAGGRLEVKRAFPPLKDVEAACMLAPREKPLLLLFHRAQGRRDELLVWVTYRSQPEQEVVAARHADRQLQSRLKNKRKTPLSASSGPHGLLVASEQSRDEVLYGKVQTFLERYGKDVRSLALRGNKPHLFLKADLRITRSGSAEAFFSALRDLGDRNAPGPGL